MFQDRKHVKGVLKFKFIQIYFLNKLRFKIKVKTLP